MPGAQRLSIWHDAGGHSVDRIVRLVLLFTCLAPASENHQSAFLQSPNFRLQFLQ